MSKQPLPVSSSLAALLRDRRLQMNLSLRDVENSTRRFGEPIPFTTLGKVERGVVDPGALRLNLLCKIYGIPLQVAGDALDLENAHGPLVRDERSTSVLIDEATTAWKHGSMSAAFATLAALRRRGGDSDPDRQKGLLHFAILAGSLGKNQLASAVIDDLLVEPPVPELLVRVLVQAAVCWHRRGSTEAALGFLSRAELNVGDNDIRQTAYVAHETASVLTTMRQFDRAEAEVERALSAYREAGNVYGEGGALAVGIRIASSRGNHDLAVARATQALDHARRHKLDRLVYLRMIDLASGLIELGRFAEAHERLDNALAAALVNQDHPAQFFIYHARWRGRRAAGDHERARLELSAARYAMRYADENCAEAREVRAAPDDGDWN